MTTSAALDSALSSLATVDLAAMNAAAALTQRVDTKYLVPAAVLADLLPQLRSSHACLSIDDRRSHSYTSSYVDTPELVCFHDHRRGVRKRWKARTRVYEDSGHARWEVKLKDGRGLTVKHALPLPANASGDVTTEMRAFLHDVLGRSYQHPAPPELDHTLTVRYLRSTLADLTEGTRMTMDSDLQMRAARGHASLNPELVLVETKSMSGRSTADCALRSAGARACSVSKYCLGMALLDPTLPSHPWQQLLRRSFTSPRHVSSVDDHGLAA